MMTIKSRWRDKKGMVEIRNIYTVCVGNSEEKRPLEGLHVNGRIILN
jgi:hypothetical protein